MVFFRKTKINGFLKNGFLENGFLEKMFFSKIKINGFLKNVFLKNEVLKIKINGFPTTGCLKKMGIEPLLHFHLPSHPGRGA